MGCSLKNMTSAWGLFHLSMTVLTLLRWIIPHLKLNAAFTSVCAVDFHSLYQTHYCFIHLWHQISQLKLWMILHIKCCKVDQGNIRYTMIKYLWYLVDRCSTAEVRVFDWTYQFLVLLNCGYLMSGDMWARWNTSLLEFLLIVWVCFIVLQLLLGSQSNELSPEYNPPLGSVSIFNFLHLKFVSILLNINYIVLFHRLIF